MTTLPTHVAAFRGWERFIVIRFASRFGFFVFFLIFKVVFIFVTHAFVAQLCAEVFIAFPFIAFIIANLNHLVISDFAAAEVAAALSRLVLMCKMDATDAAERMADFDAWRAEATDAVEVQASDVRLSNVLVRRFDLMLRAPDALHAAICRRTGDDLVTLDHRMAKAAAELGIAVVVPGK